MHSFPTYLDFNLDISDLDGQTFTVIVRSDIGEAREQTHFPFSDEELAHQLLKLENAILRSTDLHRGGMTPQPDVVETFGRALFDFILPGEARSLFNESLREAEHRHRGVRLKLSVHSPRLAALPWEFLYDPRRRDYLCLNLYTPLVRYTELPQTAPPLEINAPLRILGLLSDPQDMPTRLNVEQERDHITAAVQSLINRGLVELTWLEGNSWRDLQRLMRTPNDGWHIFHFIGHGGYDALRNEGYIVLNNEDGTSHHLYASQLARMMARQRSSMRLVLLNACEGARTGTHDALSSTAATLITSGIPAVLAMQYEITNEAATEFANSFYEALADNFPVDAAVAEARNALSISNARSLEWGVPVLYMRAVDGHLFSIQESGRVAQSRQIPMQEEKASNDTAIPDCNQHVAKPSAVYHLRGAERGNFVPNHATFRTVEMPPIRQEPLVVAEDASQAARSSSKESATTVNADELTWVVAAAMEDHLSGDTLLDSPPELLVAVPTKPEWSIVQTIDQLDEQVLIEASARVQGAICAAAELDRAHRFYDEHDESEEPYQVQEADGNFHHKGKQKPPTDPLDVESLLASYAKRQHALIGFNWITIPAGVFWLGSDPLHDAHMFEDELPQVQLYLDNYRIARVPVTNAQYKLFVDAVGYPAPSHWLEGDYPEEQKDHPVTNVSWNDANAFCEWAGARLPTEAEWEKAARGVDGRIYPWGDADPDPTRCNFDLTIGMTVAVGSYPHGASPYGVLDMAGNVWEWTATPWLDSYDNYLVMLARQSPTALRRVLRGGGFRDLEFVRCASRSWDLPNQCYRDLGFRVVAL